MLDGVGVSYGWQCLEVGAGSGTVAAWLADRVVASVQASGERSGRVVATDLDTDHLRRLPAPGIEVLQHDVVRDSLPSAAFDLVHARFVLEHLPEREAVIDRLIETLAPGGWLVVESLADFPARETQDSAFQLTMQAIREVLSRTIGTDSSWAWRLPAGMLDRGLVDVGAATFVPLTGVGNASALCWSLTLRQLAPRIVEAGLCSSETVDETLQQLADPNFSDFGIGTLSAWGRRPTSHHGSR